MLVAPEGLCYMMFYLETFVCWLKEKGGMGAWALGVIEKAGILQGTWHLFSQSSWAEAFSIHINLCSKESRISARVEETIFMKERGTSHQLGSCRKRRSLLCCTEQNRTPSWNSKDCGFPWLLPSMRKIWPFDFVVTKVFRVSACFSKAQLAEILF